MPRPRKLDEQRQTLIPIVARTFSDLGFRRTTTAELARRCKVQENILYRLWKDKKAMFIASLDYVYDLAAGIWADLARREDGRTAAERTLEYESEHLGEFGHHRLIFAGLNETDDADIRRAMARLYRRFHRFITQEIEEHHRARSRPVPEDAARRAWAIIGLATIANIGREAGVLGSAARRELVAEVGRDLLDG